MSNPLDQSSAHSHPQPVGQQSNHHEEHGHDTTGHHTGHYFHDGQLHPTQALHLDDSPDSANGFVKIEKPKDLHSYQASLGSTEKVEITPSDEVAPLTGDDFKRDYAPSPQQFASELASNAHESLEQFLAATQRTASDVTSKGSRFASDLVGQFSPVEEEPVVEAGQAAMYEEEEEDEDEYSPERLEKAKEEVLKRMENVQAQQERESEEATYQRHGPLTLGTPTTISTLSPQHHGGLTDVLHNIQETLSDAAHSMGTKISDAAHAVSDKMQGEDEKPTFKAESTATGHGVGDFAHDAQAKVKDVAHDAQAKVTEAAHDVKAKVTEAAHDAQAKFQDVQAKIIDTTHDAHAKVKDTVEGHSPTKESAHQIGTSTVEQAKELGHKVSDKAQEVGGKVVDSAAAVKHSMMGESASNVSPTEHAKEFHGKIDEPTADIKNTLGGQYASSGVSPKQYAQEVGGKVIDAATATKDALSEFASNVSTKVTSATGDLFDFGPNEKENVPTTVKHKEITQPTTLLQKTIETPTVKPAASLKSPGTAKSTCCFVDLQSMDPRMLDLIYWREPRKSGIVFAATLAFLICLAVFPVISVAAYTGLIIILGTLSFRLYKMIMAYVQKTDQQNPFKPYLETDLKIPEDRVHQQVENVVQHVVNLLVQLRRLFLVENVVDTLKFAVLLWALTYVGACLSVMALVIIAFVGLFTIPKFYETYKTQIDHYYNLVHSKVKQVIDMIQEKVPQLKQKPHTEKIE